MSSTSAPDAFILVVAVVVTVTGRPLAVLMTRLLPFTCSSVPLACSSWAHPVTAVSAVTGPLPAVPGACPRDSGAHPEAGADQDERGRRAGQHGAPPGTRQDAPHGVPRPGRLSCLRLSIGQAADPFGHEVPPVRLEPAAARSRRDAAGPGRPPAGRRPRRSGPRGPGGGSWYLRSSALALLVKDPAQCGARRGQAALHRPDGNLQHAGDLGEAEPGAEGQAQHLPVG